jgi:hypothetical protein
LQRHVPQRPDRQLYDIGTSFSRSASSRFTPTATVSLRWRGWIKISMHHHRMPTIISQYNDVNVLYHQNQ